MLITVLTVVQVFVAIGVIALVLLQRGRGADAGAGFGAGASATVFGARGASTGLSRATAILAAVFMINSLALAYLGTRAPATQTQGLLESGAPASGSPATTTTVTPSPSPEPAPAAPPATVEPAPMEAPPAN
jgi:preprotein translocase subunit SecG